MKNLMIVLLLVFVSLQSNSQTVGSTASAANELLDQGLEYQIRLEELVAKYASKDLANFVRKMREAKEWKISSTKLRPLASSQVGLPTSTEQIGLHIGNRIVVSEPGLMELKGHPEINQFVIHEVVMGLRLLPKQPMFAKCLLNKSTTAEYCRRLTPELEQSVSLSAREHQDVRFFAQNFFKTLGAGPDDRLLLQKLLIEMSRRGFDFEGLSYADFSGPIEIPRGHLVKAMEELDQSEESRRVSSLWDQLIDKITLELKQGKLTEAQLESKYGDRLKALQAQLRCPFRVEPKGDHLEFKVRSQVMATSLPPSNGASISASPLTIPGIGLTYAVPLVDRNKLIKVRLLVTDMTNGWGRIEAIELKAGQEKSVICTVD